MKKSKTKQSSSSSKFFSSILKRVRYADIAFIALIILLVGFAWRLLPQTVIRSDGFIHMLKDEQKRFWDQDYWFTGIEVGPSILGAILPKFFGPNVSLYLWFEVGVILLVTILFYILVKTITRSRLLAFTAAIITGVSYFGTWNVYGPNCYCFYMERVINMPFMIVSFLFLHLFLVNRKMLYLIISLSLYIIGIGLGHVELILTPAFMLYPFWWFFLYSWKKETWKGLLIAAIYFLISIGITWAQTITYGNWGPGWTLTEFTLHPEKYNYFTAMALQLVYWSDYTPLWGFFSSPNVLGRFSVLRATASIPYVLITYFFVFLLLIIRLPKFKTILLTIFTSIPILLFLNSYVKLKEIVVPDSNRYLYFPTFFLSIFWGIFVWYVFLQHNDFRRVFGMVILVAYYAINVSILNSVFHLTFEWNKSTRKLFDHVIETRNKLEPNTLVVATYPEFWVQEADFFSENLGRSTVRYETDSTSYGDWKIKMPQYKHVIKIQYDKNCDCVKETKIK